MNQRILELAKTAGLKFPSETALSPSEEKFAELIVRECIDTINGVPNGYVDYRNQIEDAMREACVDTVKQKFGVEDERTN